MKIIILGAGQVGSTLAEHLANENNDVTMIEKDLQCIHNLEEKFDIRTVCGHASYPNLLLRAGAEEADMLIAVTNSDETNMIACQVAHTLFQVPTKIARIRSLQYLAYENLFDVSAIPIDVLISPEQLVTNHIKRLVEHPNAMQVFDFANKNVRLVAVKAFSDGPLIGHEIKILEEHLPDVDVKVIAIFRDHQAIIPTEKTVIQENDEVFFLAATHNIRKVMSQLRSLDLPNNRIIIAGGGNIGTRLAIALEKEFYVKVIDHNADKIEFLAVQLKKGIALHGDACDKDLLYNENIENTDVFCAVTNNDEVNIMSSMLAKHLGAGKVLTLINKIPYIDVVQDSKIDVVISPQQITVGSLLTYIRRGDVLKVHSLRRGAAEAIEAKVHGDKSTSKVVGKKISEISLPDGATIGAIVRKDEVIINKNDTIIQPGDHVIIFLTDKKRLSYVEKLFHID